MPIDTPRSRTLWARKKLIYRWLYELTFNSCGMCVESGCACKDRICGHVEDQAAKRGVQLTRGDHPSLRFIGPRGCTVAPHLRETCTIYVCSKAQEKPGFDHTTYRRLRDVAAKLDWEIMTLEEEVGEMLALP